MDFGQAFSRGLKIAQLNRGAIRETADDAGALAPGLVIFAIGQILAAIGSVALNMVMGQQSPINPAIQILATPFIALIFVFIMGGIFHLLAKLFGGDGGYMGLMRAYTHGPGLIGWVGVIPCIGGIVAFFWGVAAAVVIIAENYRMSVGKAVVVVLIPLFLCIGAGVAAIVLGVGAAMSSGAFGG